MAGKKTAQSPEEKLARALVPQEEWPYELPRGWVWTRVGNLTQVVGGGTPKTSVKEYYENGDIPWICPADLSGYKGKYIRRGAKNITQLGLEKSSAILMPAKTVLLSSRAPIGYVAIAANKIATNQGFKSFLPTLFFLPDYLYWYLKGSTELLKEYASGTTFLELSKSKAEKILFPLPPLLEQQRIVDKIQSLFAWLDEARDKLQQVLEGTEARRAAILHEAFSGGWGKKDSAECRGKSEEGEEIPLRQCGSWHGGGTPSKSHPEYWENGNIMWITSKDMKFDVINESQISVNKMGIDNSSAVYSDKPAVLFVMRSGILRHTLPISMVQKPYTVNQDLKALTPKKGILPEYIMWACKAREKSILNHCMKSGTTVESINFQSLMDFKIPIFPENIQIWIIEKINKELSAEQKSKKIVQSALAQIDLLKKAILARAFRGELGTGDPYDPSALELLKECL